MNPRRVVDKRMNEVGILCAELFNVNRSIEALVERKERLERSIDLLNKPADQMTVGGFLKALESLPEDAFLTPGVDAVVSERRNYRQAALEMAGRGDHLDAAGLRRVLENAVRGQVFEGWKGGDFRFGEDTPLWITPNYGEEGKMVVGIEGSKIKFRKPNPEKGE